MPTGASKRKPRPTRAVTAQRPAIALVQELSHAAKRIARKNGSEPAAFLEHTGIGKTMVENSRGSCIFSQGDVADAVFYIREGTIKICVVSKQGKEAVIGLLSPGDFVGEECVASGHPVRLTTAKAMTDCVLLKISRKEMSAAISQQHAPLSDVFVSFLLARNARFQEDLVDHLFNSSEKRLARVLLLLAQFGKRGKPELTVIPKHSQEMLAEMVGTTRSRVSHFMNRFREMGFIEYNGEMRIHSSLLNVILHD